ncbi:MAG: hypothetical protein N2319_07685 [Candidatus Kapabacteria bacterium]|nr:hypothetical protein [Candidatus Kapabacteria bacterium]
MKSLLNFNDLNDMDSLPSALNGWFLQRLGGRSLPPISHSCGGRSLKEYKRFLDKQGMTVENKIPVCTGMTGEDDIPLFVLLLINSPNLQVGVHCFPLPFDFNQTPIHIPLLRGDKGVCYSVIAL